MRKKEDISLGRAVRQGCSMSPVLFSVYGDHLSEEALEDIEDVDDVSVGGGIVETIKYEDG